MRTGGISTLDPGYSLRRCYIYVHFVEWDNVTGTLGCTWVREKGCGSKVQNRLPSTISRGFPDGNGLPEPVPVVNGIDDRPVVDTERVNDTHSGQTVDADGGLVVNIEDFLLTVDLVGTVADCTVVIGEEAVQACSEYEDVTGLGNV